MSVTGESCSPDNAPALPPSGRSGGHSFGPSFRGRPLPLPHVGAGNSIIPARCSRSSPTRALISFGSPRTLVHSNARHTLRAISARIGGFDHDVAVGPVGFADGGVACVSDAFCVYENLFTFTVTVMVPGAVH